MAPRSLPSMVPKRLRGLEELSWPGGPRVFVARSLLSRLLGLAFLAELPRDCGLLLPRCSTVHTFGMRFALDLVFVDADGDPVRIVRDVGPRRIIRRRGAAAVLERAARPSPPAC